MAQNIKFTNFGLIEESTAGTTPSSALQLYNLGGIPSFNRERQIGSPSIVTSADLRRYPDEVLQEDGSLSLPSTPLQYRNWLEVYEGLYGNDVTTVAQISGTDISVTSDVMNSVAGGFGNLADGDCLYITFAEAGDGTTGVYGPITSASANNITFPAGQLADFSAGNTVTINDFDRLTDSTTYKSYSVEWQPSQLTTYFESGVYYTPQTLGHSWQQGQFATQEATLAGKPPGEGAATIGTGAATAAPTSNFMNSAGRFGTVYIASTATNLAASCITPTWSHSINRSVGRGYGVGGTGFSAAVLGDLTSTISFSMVLDDNSKALRTNMEAHDTLWVRWDVVDEQGNRIIWFEPSMKINTDTTGENDTLYTKSFELNAHDPAKDSGSTFVSAGFGFQSAVFFVDA